jgi:hypothetical protein
MTSLPPNTPAARIPTLVVIGGGEQGVVAVRQLLRARAAGRLDVDTVRVVDRRAECEARDLVREPGVDGPAVVLDVSPWSSWLAAHLARLGPRDHVVPYHWAPHLFLDWLLGEVRGAGGRAEREGTLDPRGLPFEAVTATGDRALSYADWVCPPLCIEPEVCPHTALPRDWSLARGLALRDAAGDRGEAIVFPCLHLTDGVGTVPVHLLQEAATRLVSGLARGARHYVVATASHCHGLAACIRVSPGVEASSEKA